MIFGMLPGLGGVAAVSILLPFIYYLDDYAGLAMLLGAVSVVYTADTITSVLLGAPGSPASAPTAIEGHALAKQGEAAIALGVGFLASMVGGLVGALVLFFAIPIAGPIVLLLSTPELFMFALVGLFFASSMIGKDLAKGLAAACLGLFLGVVGPASWEVGLTAFVLVGFVYARQVLMPQINHARDAELRGSAGAARRFARLHRISVIINGLQWLAVFTALVLVLI